MRCYYAVLEVERDVDDAALKKAYRKQALRWHPDKNRENADEAEARFKEVQAAYEVLADRHERAWYDAHRDAILRGDDAADGEARDDTMASGGINLWAYFRPGCFRSFAADGALDSFFAVYGALFANLAAHERAAGDSAFGAPAAGFGGAAADYARVVRPFYTFWTNFQSTQSFAWEDVYRLPEAPNRRVRRLMEKENAKARDKARREFNERVRHLASTVKKRDPRVEEARRRHEREEHERHDREAEQRRARAQERVREQAALEELYEDEHEHVDAMLEELLEANDANAKSAPSGASSSGAAGEYECVACSRSFKSAGALKSHENSKKHKQAVAKLKKEMEAEEREMQAEAAAQSSEEVLGSSEVDELSSDDENAADEIAAALADAKLGNGNSDGSEDEAESENESKEDESEEDESDDDEEESSSDKVPELLTRAQQKLQERLAQEEGESRKRGGRRRAAKRNKLDVKKGVPPESNEARISKAQIEREAAEGKHRCGICLNVFPSRSKLFKHIKDKGHAMYK